MANNHNTKHNNRNFRHPRVAKELLPLQQEFARLTGEDVTSFGGWGVAGEELVTLRTSLASWWGGGDYRAGQLLLSKDRAILAGCFPRWEAPSAYLRRLELKTRKGEALRLMQFYSCSLGLVLAEAPAKEHDGKLMVGKWEILREIPRFHRRTKSNIVDELTNNVGFDIGRPPKKLISHVSGGVCWHQPDPHTVTAVAPTACDWSAASDRTSPGLVVLVKAVFKEALVCLQMESMEAAAETPQVDAVVEETAPAETQQVDAVVEEDTSAETPQVDAGVESDAPAETPQVDAGVESDAPAETPQVDAGVESDAPADTVSASEDSPFEAPTPTVVSEMTEVPDTPVAKPAAGVVQQPPAEERELDRLVGDLATSLTSLKS
jgi:hypothetical protein